MNEGAVMASLLDWLWPLLLVPVCALADRLRGGLFPKCRHCDLAGELGYGLALALLLDLPMSWATVVVPWVAWVIDVPLVHWYVLTMALWASGARPGWGYPMGQVVLGKVQHRFQHPDATPEWWQVWRLKDWPVASLVVRGLMWGVPLSPLFKIAVKRRWTLPVVIFVVAMASWWLWSHVPALVTLPVAMAVAMPVAALIDRAVPYRYRAGEWIRGALMGLAGLKA